MNVEYNPYIQKFYVKGLGYFNSPAEARDSIAKHNEEDRLSDTILIKFSPTMRKQWQQLADDRKVTLSQLIRDTMNKEVMNNGN